MVIAVIVGARRRRLGHYVRYQISPAMFEPDAESMPAEPLTGLQLERLRALIDRLLALGGLQGTRLKEAGVAAGADVNLATLSRLPTTDKRDLWEAYPFGLLAVPRTEVVAVHGSSGTGAGRLWSPTPGTT